jgi:hypothetical protein
LHADFLAIHWYGWNAGRPAEVKQLYTVLAKLQAGLTSVVEDASDLK